MSKSYKKPPAASGTHKVDTMSDYYIAFTTCPNADVATAIAQGAVQQRLAACVNIIPNIQSVYQWQGKIETDNELLLVIKTKQHALAALEIFIQQQHPYDVPEFVSVNIESGATTYLNWITDSLQLK